MYRFVGSLLMGKTAGLRKMECALSHGNTPRTLGTSVGDPADVAFTGGCGCDTPCMSQWGNLI